MKKYAAVLLFVIILIPSASASTCTKNVYYLTSGYSFADGNVEFGYIDMDMSKGGQQDITHVPQGETTTAEITWGWGTNCPDCTVYINAFGNWNPSTELMKLYSGPKGEFKTYSKIPISFVAPDTPGAYKFRVIFAYDKEHAIDFDGSNLCSEKECQTRGECNVLIAEGDVNVTAPGTKGTESLSVELTSPRTAAVSGILRANIGSVIPINADVTAPPNTTVNVTIEIDDREVSGFLPYSWNTFNSSEGTHWIVVVAEDENGSLTYDEIEVLLLNKTGEHGTIPPLIWKQRIKGTVNDIDISEKGAYVVAGSIDGFAYLFDIQGKKIWEHDLSESVNSVSIDATGERLLFASGSILYYLNGEGLLVWNYTSSTEINSVAMSRKGDRIAFSSENVLYYLTGNGSLLWTYSTSNPINNIAINSDGSKVSSASGNVLYYFKGDGTLDWTYSSTTEINSVSMNHEGDRIAFTSGDILYYMDNLASLLWNLTDISDVSLSSDDSLILAKSNNILQAVDNRGSTLWKDVSEDNIGTISLSPQGKFLIYSEGDSIFLKDNSRVTIGEEPRIEIYAAVILFAILVAGIFVQMKGPSYVLSKIGIKKVQDEKDDKEAVKARTEVATLSLLVTNNKTKRPIKGAKVLSGNSVTYTNENGKAIFEDVQFGEHTVTVEKEEYRPGQELRTVGEGENLLEMSLIPQVGTTGKNEEALKGIMYNLSKEYESVSNYDTCLPDYYKSIGARIVEFLEMLSYSPEFFEADNREAIIDSFVEAGAVASNGLRDVISDWRNVKLYQASSELEKSQCDAKVVEVEKLRASLTNPEAMRHEIERRLSELDKKMMDKMNELTIIPVSTLWQVSKDLLRESLAASGYRKLGLLFFANILTEYTDNMLEDPEIVKRLKFAIL